MVPALTRALLDLDEWLLHKRDEKGVRICRLLRDRIETLEDVIKDS